MSESEKRPHARALEGLVVADFSRVLAGPYASMMLADLGADVVKVERPGQGDETRSWGPPHAADGTSTYYLSVNRNKRSVALDLADEADRQRALAIALSADVLIENFRPGTLRRFALDYSSLKAQNSGLVYCSITGFGTGPGKDVPGYDFVAQAVSGWMSITGAADGPPTKTGVAVIDVITGLNAVIGILAALRHRAETGKGQHVEVNLLSSALSALVNQASGYLNAGVVPGRMSNEHPSIAPYETLATATTPIAVAVGNDGQFAQLCGVLGIGELASNPLYADNSSRVSNRAGLRAILESVLTQRSGDDWLALLSDAGVPCGAVNTIDQAFAYAAKLGLDPVVTLSRPDGTVTHSVANPIRLSKTPAAYWGAPPELGDPESAAGDGIADTNATNR